MSELDGLGANDLARLLNAKRSRFTFRGQVHEIKELDLEQLAQISVWLEERAHAAITRATWMPDAERREARADLVAAIAAGDYAPGGIVYAKAMVTPDGQAKILHVALEDAIPGLTVEDCEGMLKEHGKECATIAQRIEELKAAEPAAPAKLLADCYVRLDALHLEAERIRLAIQAAVPIDPKAWSDPAPSVPGPTSALPSGTNLSVETSTPSAG